MFYLKKQLFSTNANRKVDFIFIIIELLFISFRALEGEAKTQLFMLHSDEVPLYISEWVIGGRWAVGEERGAWQEPTNIIVH